jgi:uncharacterized protein YrzB (UPF0473 family)
MSEELRMNEEDISNIVMLEDENGNPVPMQFLDLIEYQGAEYVVFYPCNEEEQDGEVIILQILPGDDPEEEAYVSVEDEATLEAVFAIFKEKFKDHITFAD